MKCPYCGNNQERVIDSRESADGTSTRRRHECEKCKRRFTTYEKIEKITYMVIKKDGAREKFDREKLMGGILKACEKRPVETAKMEAIANDIEAMFAERVDREIRTQEIGNYVMEKLKEYDKVAYVRFASVYKDFQDPEEFVKEIQHIVTGSKAAQNKQKKKGE